jgi:hypothetical protein
MSLIMIVLLAFLVLVLTGDARGHSRWGFAGWPSVGALIAVFLVLWLSGNLQGAIVR